MFASEDEDESKEASEEAPGVEDTAKMPFNEVSDELGVSDIRDTAEPIEVVEDQTTYVVRLEEAVQRLDIVATECEKQGKQDIAVKLDRVANSIEHKISQIKKASKK